MRVDEALEYVMAYDDHNASLDSDALEALAAEVTRLREVEQELARQVASYVRERDALRASNESLAACMTAATKLATSYQAERDSMRDQLRVLRGREP